LEDLEMLSESQCQELVKLAYENPEALKRGYRDALAQQFAASVGGAQFSYDARGTVADTGVEKWQLQTAIDTVCRTEGRKPITSQEMASEALRILGKTYSRDEYKNVFTAAHKATVADLIRRHGWVSVAGGVDASPPNGWNNRQLSKTEREHAVNSMLPRRPGQEPYREGQDLGHWQTSPHSATKRPRAEPAAALFSTEDAESVPAEAKHFDAGTEEKVVSVLKPYLDKHADASDDQIVRHVFSRLPYLDAHCKLTEQECRLSILSTLVRRFGRTWNATEHFKTKPAEYSDGRERPAHLPRSVDRPRESLREKARVLLESKGASAFSVDDSTMTATERQKLIDRMVAHAR
jgi:hypothetical protein